MSLILETYELIQTRTRYLAKDGKVTFKHTVCMLESGQCCSHSAFLIFCASLQWNNAS